MTKATIPTAQLSVLPDAQLTKLSLDPQLSVVADIVNSTGRELTVITRNGLRFLLPTHRVSMHRTVYFRESFELTREGAITLNPTDSPFNKAMSPAERIYDTIQNALSTRNGFVHRKTGRAVHELHMEQLLDAGGPAWTSPDDGQESFVAEQLSA